MRTSILALMGAAALGLAACAEREVAPVVADPATERTVEEGRVVGFTHADNGAQVWLGLPYADAPDGDLRWRAPRWAEGWLGTREALEHNAPCPQLTNALNAEAFGVEPGQLIGSEDCLIADIYAPPGAGPDNAERPVMVWIHGGSNTWGSARQYDGSQLAVDQDVVVVVIQYRLGPLGFFAHPAIAEDIEIEEDSAANFALLDQLAALYWVRENINQFGGDAGNVTIFGESAGGHNVASLMASPLADDLFHRAIIQSGSFRSVPLSEAQAHPQYGAVQAAVQFAGPDASAADIRTSDLQAVYQAYAGEYGSIELPTIIQDGVTIPETPLADAFNSTDTFHAVPVITGTTRDEMKLFNAFDPELTSTLFGVIIRSRDPQFYDTVADYQSRIWRALSVDEAADTMKSAGHDEVWAYRFDWDEGGSMFFMDFSHLLGAGHAVEIPFVFNHFDFFGRLDGAMFNTRNAEGRTALTSSMGAYWAEFARSGDPASAGGPDWPNWHEGGRLMRFDSPEDGGQEIITGNELVTGILRDLANDETLDETQRCMVYTRLTGWFIEEDDPRFEC